MRSLRGGVVRSPAGIASSTLGVPLPWRVSGVRATSSSVKLRDWPAARSFSMQANTTALESSSPAYFPLYCPKRVFALSRGFRDRNILAGQPEHRRLATSAQSSPLPAPLTSSYPQARPSIKPVTSKWSIPLDGILLYKGTKQKDFRMIGLISAVNGFVFAIYAATQGQYLWENGEFWGGSTLIVSVALGLGVASSIFLPLFGRFTTRRAVKRLWALPAGESSAISNTIRVETYSMFGNPRALRFRPRGNYFYYLMNREGEFYFPDALEKLLNGEQVTFK